MAQSLDPRGYGPAPRPGPGKPQRPPHQKKKPQRRSGGSRVFSGALFTVLVLVALIASAAAFVLYVLPANFVRDRMIAEVKTRTGRDLVIAGPARFTVYPSLGVSLGDVSLSPPPGMTGKPFVTMKSLDVAIPLLPLLKSEVKIERLVLRNPVFVLAVDGDGRKSWDFAALEPQTPVRLAQVQAPASDAPGGLPSDAAPPPAKPSLVKLEKLAFGDVRIQGGAVSYSDARTGTAHELKYVNLDVDLPALTAPLSAKGSLAWRGKRFDLDGRLTSLQSVLEDTPAKVAFAVTSDALSATFDGTVSFKDAGDAAGAVALASPSVRRLAHWLGNALPPSRGFGALDAKGDLRRTGNTITLSNAQIALDGATAAGQIAVTTGAARPQVKANLKLSTLDLNMYATDPSAATVSAPAPPKANSDSPKAGPAPAAAKPQSIDDLLDREPGPGTKVKAYAKRAGWSTEPLDLTILGLVDADASLSVGKLLVRDIKVDKSALTVALKNSVMKTTLDDVRLYDGRAQGFITVDASAAKTANVGGNVALDGISALTFLKDAADIDWLAGKGKLQLALAGQGATQRQIVDTLNGKVDFTFTDGAIVGVNIPAMVRGLSQGKLGELNSAPAAKTDFSELSATWIVQGGVAQNQDLKLVSPLLRITGAGKVMLPQRAVDYTVRPKLVATLTGQGGAQNLAGLEIPVRIQGPWDEPDLKPDFAGVLKDPNKAVETIKEIGKQFKGKNADEIVKELLGSGAATGAAQDGSAAEGGTTNATKDAAQKLLDQFLSGDKKDKKKAGTAKAGAAKGAANKGAATKDGAAAAGAPAQAQQP